VINKKIIDEIRDRLVKTYNPLAIYIFGSHAWGMPTKDSDFDLLIIIEKSGEKSYKRPIPGQQALFGLGISKDLIVYTKKEFERLSANKASLCYKIEHDGKLIYAKS